jgi:hypothetical protein
MSSKKTVKSPELRSVSREKARRQGMWRIIILAVTLLVVAAGLCGVAIWRGVPAAPIDPNKTTAHQK